MEKKQLNIRIDTELNAYLHCRIARGQINKFVNQALWDALKKEQDLIAQEAMEADKDPGNIEVREDFAAIEGEDFPGLEDEEFFL